MGSCHSKGQKKEHFKFSTQRRESSETPSFRWESEDESELEPTCQVSEDKPEPPASSSRAIFDEKQLEVKQEIAAVTTHPLLSAEELLRYYNRALQEVRDRVVVLEFQLPVGGATMQQQQEVEAKEITDRGTQTEKINVPEMGALWTSKELLDLVREAPDPFTKPVDLYRWLRQACLVYEPRPVQVRKLLQLVFESQWQKFEDKFHVPGSDTDADWSGVDAMTTWLDGAFKTSVVSVAWSNPNKTFSYLCHQKPNESMTDFLPRYKQLMNSIHDEDVTPNAVLNLMMCLQDHVAELFQLTYIDWFSYTFNQAAVRLEVLEKRGMLESKTKTLAIVKKLQSGEEEEEINAPSSNNPRPRRRRGRCYSCGWHGHWARECPASFSIQPNQRALEWNQHALEWTYID
ncbi:uncharacterized protein [Nothobranchius furzeri]|nr:uncharacterized protein LOC107381526 [Nothobranchius furzeri]